MSRSAQQAHDAALADDRGVVAVEQLEQRALRVRQRIVEMCAGPQGGHLGGSMSLVEILCLLFFEVLRPMPGPRPERDDGDRLVLSKGHGALALYATLAEAGVLPEEAIGTYGRPGTDLGGHPSATTPGVELSTGSLGHGLSYALGIAQARALAGAPGRVYVVVGDGELQEGSVWEGLMAGAQLGLERCVLIIDRNRLQLTGATEGVIGLDPLDERLAAFGWDVRVCDGHDLADLRRAVTSAPSDPQAPARPVAVVAETVKGKGLPFIEGKPQSHYATLNERQLERCRRALRSSAAARGLLAR